MEGEDRDIVILGAGIIGLDVALVLAQRGLAQRIKVVAQYLPGDTAPEYTSPWAGCNFSAISGVDEKALRWDRMGYAHLQRLATESARESVVARTPSIQYWDGGVPHDKIKTMAAYLEDFKVISDEDLPSGVSFGTACTAFTINAPQHLKWLRGLLSDYGVRFVRARVDGLEDVFLDPGVRTVFNCVGGAARSLPGVADDKCFPTRGQVVLVRAPHVTQTVMRLGGGDEPPTYVIPRPGSNGLVVLGGYMQKGVDDAATYSHETDSIVSRATALCTELRSHPFDIVASFAGMRPSRHGGARVERQDVVVNGVPRVVVHNYGAGGTGFQAGYGMAVDAVQLIGPEVSS